MQQQKREFVTSPAVRRQVPILIGLVSPSGGGKTRSSLRLATGIQRVSEGAIVAIDTEANRMLHHADDFKFQHIPFSAPFGSLDYLAALEYGVAEARKQRGRPTIIVDQISSEHDGHGGMLDFQEEELNRLAGSDYDKRERVKMLAWGKPKQARRRLLNGILQMDCNFIFNFRTKHTSKPVKVNGKTEVVAQGFVPIAGEEFIYEMTMCALMYPKADGFPTWNSEFPGEKMAMKLPQWFRPILLDGQGKPKQFSEDIGEQLAKWAAGGIHRDKLDGEDQILAAKTLDELGVAAKGRKWKNDVEKQQLVDLVARRKGEILAAELAPAPTENLDAEPPDEQEEPYGTGDPDREAIPQ